MTLDVRGIPPSELESVLGRIVALNHTIFEGMFPWEPYSLEHYRKRLTGVMPVVFVAEQDNEIIGDSIAYKYEDPNNHSHYIWILGVQEQYRKKGIATMFLDFNEQFARKFDCDSVIVKSYNISKDMQRLLLKRNYDIIAVDRNENPKYKGVHFELDLSPEE